VEHEEGRKAMSRPRVILQCPICKCVADQVYFRRKDAWRCSFCLSYYAIAPVLPVIVSRCTHDHEGDDEGGVCGEFTFELAQSGVLLRRG